MRPRCDSLGREAVGGVKLFAAAALAVVLKADSVDDHPGCFAQGFTYGASKPSREGVVLYGDDGEITLQYTGHGGQKHKWNTTFEGVIPNLSRRYKETDSDYVRTEIARYMAEVPCTACHGARLKPESLAVTVDGRNISDVSRLSIEQALAWATTLRAEKSPLTKRERTIANQILKEIHGRLKFLSDVGVNYLTLDRRTRTLAGGEAQRIRLATQIGSSLMGVLYVCDEPSIGLHPADDDDRANEPAAHPSGTVLRLRRVFYGGPVSVNDSPFLADSAVDLRRVPTNARRTLARVLVQGGRKDAYVAV